MNRKGGGIIGFALIEIIFIINWAIWLGSLISSIGTNAVANGATGIEAFFWTNLNLFIFFMLLLVNMLVFQLGGQG